MESSEDFVSFADPRLRHVNHNIQNCSLCQKILWKVVLMTAGEKSFPSYSNVSGSSADLSAAAAVAAAGRGLLICCYADRNKLAFVSRPNRNWHKVSEPRTSIREAVGPELGWNYKRWRPAGPFRRD